MSALHDSMVQKMESCEEGDMARHVDMSAVLADIERSNLAETVDKEKNDEPVKEI